MDKTFYSIKLDHINFRAIYLKKDRKKNNFFLDFSANKIYL